MTVGSGAQIIIAERTGGSQFGQGFCLSTGSAMDVGGAARVQHGPLPAAAGLEMTSGRTRHSRK